MMTEADGFMDASDFSAQIEGAKTRMMIGHFEKVARQSGMTDQEFYEWEQSVFGYGYGTGEKHVLSAMVEFFASLKDGRFYDHDVLMERLGGPAAWLLINAFCHADIVDYGTSPRYGCLSAKGERLRDYVQGKTADELCDVLMAEMENEQRRMLQGD